jgi:hypothetical protein
MRGVIVAGAVLLSAAPAAAATKGKTVAVGDD